MAQVAHMFAGGIRLHLFIFSRHGYTIECLSETRRQIHLFVQTHNCQLLSANKTTNNQAPRGINNHSP